MLIDGEAEYLAVFGGDYDGDADVAFEIKYMDLLMGRVTIDGTLP